MAIQNSKLSCDQKELKVAELALELADLSIGYEYALLRQSEVEMAIQEELSLETELQDYHKNYALIRQQLLDLDQEFLQEFETQLKHQKALMFGDQRTLQ